MFELSRRDLIVGAAGAYAAFGLDRPLALIGVAQAQTTPAAPAYKGEPIARGQIRGLKVSRLILGGNLKRLLLPILKVKGVRL